MATLSHTARIKAELIQAGMTPYGLLKFSTRYLPKVIHSEEHIKGVVYGRYNKDTPFGFEGMLVATDRRVIFLDHKPGFTSMDEFTYNVVSGVMSVTAGLFTSLTLQTKLGEFTIRFANAKCVSIFEKYIEERRLETLNTTSPTTKKEDTPMIQKAAITPDAQDFLRTHNIGVLSTLDRSGEIQSRAVYFTSDDNGTLYILSKAGTEKVRNIFAHNKVALTSYDPSTYQTVQIQGIGEIEGNQAKKDEVYHTITNLRDETGKPRALPITTFHDGAFLVLRITPTAIKYTDFQKKITDQV